jgi:hypothetical protein
MVGFAILQGECHRRAVRNMQDAGAKDDAMAKGCLALSATTSYLQTLQTFRLQTGY